MSIQQGLSLQFLAGKEPTFSQRILFCHFLCSLCFELERGGQQKYDFIMLVHWNMFSNSWVSNRVVNSVFFCTVYLNNRQRGGRCLYPSNVLRPKADLKFSKKLSIIQEMASVLSNAFVHLWPCAEI